MTWAMSQHLSGTYSFFITSSRWRYGLRTAASRAVNFHDCRTYLHFVHKKTFSTVKQNSCLLSKKALPNRQSVEKTTINQAKINGVFYKSRKSEKASIGKYVNIASQERTNHILFGDGTGGGHLYPGVNGRSVFPRSWDARKIMHHISDIATDPKIPWKQISRKVNAYLSKNGLPSRYQAIGSREGIVIKAIIEPAGRGIVTAYPIP